MPKQRVSFYSRLFPDQYGGYPKKSMSRLTDLMEDIDADKRDRPRAVPGLIHSGYVYFAQFVNHDLSLDKTKLSEAGNLPPELTTNYRTPCLDLEILYGNGLDNEGCLKLGTTQPVGSESESDNDLDRDSVGQANICDKRNDSTLLLAQLHVLLSKFHNRLLEDVREGKVPSVSEGNEVEETKRLVRWHYQWIVRNDLLPKIVMRDVLEDITLHWPRLFRPKLGEASIPVEFSLAAFQYGHSAVNFIYNINCNVIKCPQLATMYLTGPGHFQWPIGSGPIYNRLPQTYVVDPSRMFGWAPRAKLNFSAMIGTLIEPGLYEVPGDQSILFNNEPLESTGLTLTRPTPGRFKLPEATLFRGAAVGLPSGQQASQMAGVDTLGADQLARNSTVWTFLNENGMLNRTPLFYYLLREAEVSGRCGPGKPPGTRLGPLGSRIVAEVILGVLNADPDSYVHTWWEPPRIVGNSQDVEIRIDSLKKLMFYAKDYKSRASRRL